ncbi:bifunctional 2-C-methyl-D-erythritol 4-phosphate cytidylyltransferase/2-C-methyl-D-erythritol 2,4-cyclodiphosphate synthase [Pseudovibrio sp. Tun.PSC04-5.I4]|uniref:bifunctional 2-C-methyl-D-erythritol 4-phosphate cytidylyltransferase/2-C-methyl-D-erythritol 2,4-cyclodiphosphate synthase n=1 Tax=Pseudovibrio sp. Tun.PSC04-5.I4 TaxID=1798213 RepID=UPI000881408F|nr:bifunctional 2-C-methyl-D-erythritol 4-phosphate cytidylyltransferase/2-C-methyl-D-erythritol 2,4-cyclodiphosphate synthase [Pseudovibrio sp. Tun.PSC04-5.I4]SDR05505.1 2-C-methyl-D-erythritol 2,4-cyclodiphosphate synthase [Pseudovibrio sp. Tun.PSC04-5.I4]
MQSKPKIACIIVAAGRGSRMSTQTDSSPKQYRDLGGKTVLLRTLEAILTPSDIDLVLPVIHADDGDTYAAATRSLTSSKVLAPVTGGATRQASVASGLKALQQHQPDYVLIHDAARPFVSPSVIEEAIAALKAGAQAVLPAVQVADTLKRAGANHKVLETVDRTNLWSAQTPQGFPYALILETHKAAIDQNIDNFTDDTALIEWQGKAVTLTTGDPQNIKLTTLDDMKNAQEQIAMKTLADLGDIRVGTGFDVHAFEDGNAVILGGISIAHTQKLKGHSDADVALHALTDAIFGALADGDIGSHFPPSDMKWKGAASDQFLKYAIDRVHKRGGMVAHLDLTVICEAPKIGPHRDDMRKQIAEICDLPLSRVAVKATTSEKLGFTGRSEGIAAQACATIRLPFGD